MKPYLLILSIFLKINLFSQDTIDVVEYYDGSKSFTLITTKDTLLVWLYPGGKKEAVCSYRGYEANGVYKRWYKNGKQMWSKEMKAGKENGDVVYYNDKGEKVAEFIYAYGEISDTVFIKDNTHLVLGDITYTSKVYGGAVRDDGSSNISESSGPYIHCNMYVARLDSGKTVVALAHFKTDFMGKFFVLVSEGRMGFFPESVKVESLVADQLQIPTIATGSTFITWRENGPWLVGKNDKILKVSLHQSSQGYAP